MRHFEGWELGAITVGLVLAAALLAVPRAAPPGIFPVPLVNVAERRAARARLDELAARAERAGLPFETRAVGDALRRLGLALSGQPDDADHLRRVLAERVQLALAAGQRAELLQLCALQTKLFVRAVREHRFGEKASAELAALGGDFVERAQASGWAGPSGFRGSDDELGVLFAMRWLELTRLRHDPQLRPRLSEVRAYYRYLLLHPERGPGVDGPRIERAQRRLRYVEALARHDRDYPVGLARGSLLAELGMMAESSQALGAYLAGPARAEWSLRAKNYLLYATSGRIDEP